jgi:peptide/nickel transport system permease protein
VSPVLRVVASRLAGLLVTLLVASGLLFVALNASPGDLAARLAGEHASAGTLAAIRAQLGLNRPLWERYASWIGGVVHGNFGSSFVYQQSVGSLIAPKIGVTLLLIAYSAVLIIVAGVGAGAWSAFHRRAGGALTGIMSIGLAIPSFVAAAALVWLLCIQVHWFPPLGDGGPGLGDELWHLTLPAVTLALVWVAYVAQITRTGVRAELGSTHVSAARLRGLTEATVRRRHVLRNALIPIVTIAGLTVGGLLAGTVVVETVFGVDGLGAALETAVGEKDTTVVQAIGLIMVTAFVVVNTVSDLIVMALDPRIRAEASR